MTPREIIERTLDFTGPSRVAYSFPHGQDDFVGAVHTAKTHATEWQRINQRLWRRKDEWGNTWRRLDSSSKGEVADGAIKDLEDADSYEFPDFSDPKDYQQARTIRQKNPDKYLLAGVPGFAFNIARKLLKLDSYLVSLDTTTFPPPFTNTWLPVPWRCRSIHAGDRCGPKEFVARGGLSDNSCLGDA